MKLHAFNLVAVAAALTVAAPLENAENIAPTEPVARAVDPTQPPITTITTPSPPLSGLPTQCNDPTGVWMVAECLSYADGEIPPTPLTKRGAYPQETGMAMNKEKLVAKGFVAKDEFEKRQADYPNCGAPICFGEADKTYMNMEKRQADYPNCGAPICFNKAGKAYMNTEKRDFVHGVVELVVEKRQADYPNCGAPICFDASGKVYMNMEKRQADYPNCGAPICFNEAGKAYMNMEKRDLVDAIAEDEIDKRQNLYPTQDCSASDTCFSGPKEKRVADDAPVF